MIESSEPNTIDCTENDTQGEPLRVLEESLGVVKKITQQNSRLVILIFPKSNQLLGSQKPLV